MRNESERFLCGNSWTIFQRKLLIFLIYTLIGFCCFYSILDNTYFSDDYNVIRRLAVSNIFFAPGFFRPLSDFSILSIISLFGDAPIYQYIFHIILLICCSWVLYLFCLSIDLEKKFTGATAFIAGLFFLIYPFHNESIVWAVGAGSLIAGLFCLLTLLVVAGSQTLPVKILFANIFYFLALAAYESALPLPAVVLFFLYKKEVPLKSFLPWIWSFTITILLHFFCRWSFAGVLFGNYQQEGLQLGISEYFINYFKAFYRLFVAPVRSLTTVFILVILFAISCISFLLWILKNSSVHSRLVVWKLMAAISITLIVPAVFSVSVKTSEGDRLLFLPSVFAVMLLSFILQEFVRKRGVTIFLTGLLLLYFIFSLAMNLSKWNTASKIISNIATQLKEIVTKESKITIINLPDSYHGAYIFRNGFDDFLLSRKVDTSKINVISYFMHWDYLATSDPVKIIKDKQEIILIKGYARISPTNETGIYQINVSDSINYAYNKNLGSIWFWDKHELKRIVVP
jgi:hypothetical protein